MIALATTTLLVACQTVAAPESTPAANGSINAKSERKVLLIVEENKEANEVIGSDQAPFLTSQVEAAASLTNMDAGYPVDCPSLAAYIILTSGDRFGICDDANPDKHQLDADNLFAQVATTGREYRVFAQSMQQNCQRTNTKDRVYAVRHTGAPYYTSETQRCEKWQVPLGEVGSGALHDALANGALPAFSLVVPDNCHNMHGAPDCQGNSISVGDGWLKEWMPVILDSQDYRSGNLVVIVTWDEGSKDSNHIPTLVYAPGNAGKHLDARTTHCTTLRLMQDVLGVEPLGCAADADHIASVIGVPT